MTVKSVTSCFAVSAYVLIYLFFDTIFSKILLVNSGDIQINPDPRKASPINFLMELKWSGSSRFNAHDFDILCLSETF